MSFRRIASGEVKSHNLRQIDRIIKKFLVFLSELSDLVVNRFMSVMTARIVFCINQLKS